MVAPVLSDYQYQFRDDGVLLNGDWNASLPGFIDIQSVTGLSLPDIESTEFEFDGMHGGISFAKYVKSRTIVLDGILYTTTSLVDSVIDKLIVNFMPNELDYPFYFKGAGIGQRYLNCKPLSFKADVTTLRRIGSCEVQFQLKADNPIKRNDNPTTTATSGTTYDLTNSGNVDTYPIVTITGAYSSVTIRNSTTNKVLVVTGPRVVSDITVLDFRMKSLLVNGLQKSSFASGVWWEFIPGLNNIVLTAVGSPTSMQVNTYSGWL